MKNWRQDYPKMTMNVEIKNGSFHSLYLNTQVTVTCPCDLKPSKNAIRFVSQEFFFDKGDGDFWLRDAVKRGERGGVKLKHNFF